MTNPRRSILDRARCGPAPAIALAGHARHRVAADREVPGHPLRKRQTPAAPDPASSPEPAPAQTNAPRVSLRKRLAVLVAVIGVPAMAAPGDFGAVAGDAAPEPVGRDVALAAQSALAFEQPGMSFPGSAFYYLADPPREALVALPETDPRSDPASAAAPGGRELGALIDAGPAASPFLVALSATDRLRAQDCLAQAVWYEAASESEAGQRAVAQVVLNRVAHPAWPASVCGVVYQGSQRSTGCQFTFTCDGSLARKASGATWARAQRIAREALGGSVYAPIGHATHYHTLWVDPYWAGSLDPVGTIGAHRFYRNRGRAGEKASFTARHSGFEPGMAGRLTGPADSPVAASATIAAQPVLEAGEPPSPSALPLTSAPAPGPARGLADPAFTAAGQAREAFARAGQWKVDPATLDQSRKPAGPAPAPAPAQRDPQAQR